MDTTDCYVRANSTNLPKIDMIMILEYMKSSDKHNIAEIRGVKASMTSRPSYVDNAVSYVEIKRNGNICHARAKVCPEHKLSKKYYVTEVSIDATNDTIMDTTCDGCAAAAGGCKHTLVFLYWLQKRSSEPEPTSVQCYWKKPSLTSARQEVVSSKEIFKGKPIEIGPKDKSVLEMFRLEAKKHACSKSLIVMHDINYERPEKLTSYCLFDLLIEFTLKENNHTYENFKAFSTNRVEPMRNKIAQETVHQIDSKLWHSMRQGRITGSKIYEISRCKTPNGSLVEELLGGYKLQETKAMKRGKVLEKKIIKKLEEEMNKKIFDSGFLLIDGIFGASPDGVCEDYVIEIKCPNTDKTVTNYINAGKISEKCLAQMQLEMLAAKKTKCLFCVVDPKYEENGNFTKIFVDYNEEYIVNIMSQAEEFWKTHVFPKILKSALN